MSVAARTSLSVRRVGYVIAAAVITATWFVINVWPGWEVIAFLTQRTADVVWAVNVSLCFGLVANLAYVVYDPAWFKALGDLITATTGLVASVVLWRVFPFDFSGYSFDWSVVARVVLMVGIVGGILAILIQIGTLVRLGITGGPSGHRPTEARR